MASLNEHPQHKLPGTHRGVDSLAHVRVHGDLAHRIFDRLFSQIGLELSDKGYAELLRSQNKINLQEPKLPQRQHRGRRTDKINRQQQRRMADDIL